MLLASAYFDESFDLGTMDYCFTIAGFIGGSDTFLSLGFAWRDFLKRYDLNYFKASECEGGYEEFAKFRDDPNDLEKPFSKRERDILRQIKTEAVDMIANENRLYGIGAVLMIREHQRVIAEFPNHHLPNAYNLCGQVALVAAGNIVNEWNGRIADIDSTAQLHPFFDSHKTYATPFQEIFEHFKMKNPESSRYMLAPKYESDVSCTPLQAADLFAYESRRLLVRTEYQPQHKGNKAWDRLSERVVKLYKLDYQSLKILALQKLETGNEIEAAIDNSKNTAFGM